MRGAGGIRKKRKREVNTLHDTAKAPGGIRVDRLLGIHGSDSEENECRTEYSILTIPRVYVFRGKNSNSVVHAIYSGLRSNISMYPYLDSGGLNSKLHFFYM